MKILSTQPFRLAGCVMLASSPASIFANNEESESGKALLLPEVQVEASTLTGLADTDALTSLDRDLLANIQGTTLVDAFNYTAGVTGISEGGRQSFRINVRGLEGSGRVAIDVDGAQQNLIDHNHGSATNRMWLDSSLLKSVDIVRGAAANKKGGGALAGSVSFTTIDPVDLMSPDARFGGFANAGYESNGDGWNGSLAAGVRASNEWSFLAAISARDFDNYESADGEEVIASGSRSRSILLKTVYQPSDLSALKLSYQNGYNEYEGSGAFARGQLRSGSTSEEEVTIDTFTVNYDLRGATGETLDLHVGAYHTTTERDEIRIDTGASEYHEIVTWGINLNNTSTIRTDTMSHAFTYGADWFEDDLVSLRDEINPTTSDPGGTRSQLGLFVNGTHDLSPAITMFEALRYDDFSMEDLGGTDLNGDNVSGRAGVEYRPFAQNDRWSDLTFFTSWGTGFRTPTLREAFIASEPTQGRRGFSPGTLPNPNLEPETSETWEIGLMRDYRDLFTDRDHLRLRAAYYNQDLKNIIATVPSPDPDYNTLDNLGDDNLSGIELEARYDQGRWFLGVTYDYSERDEVGSGLPGDPIQQQPWSVFAFSGIRLLKNSLTIGAEYRHVSAWEQTTETNPTVIERLTRPAYDLVNLYGDYLLTENLRLRARVDNVFDELYQGYQTLDFGPGLNAKLSVEFRF